MSLFDQLVDQALKNQVELSPLRGVVEKELLHHDIIRAWNTYRETGLHIPQAEADAWIDPTISRAANLHLVILCVT